jgi:hypothetical protein
MRLTTSLTTALAGAASLALLTACGGGSDDIAASTSSSSSAATSSSAAETSGSADPEAAAFCTDAQDAFTDLENAVTASADPSAIPGLFSDAASRLTAIEPPAEIADAWDSATSAVEQLATSLQGLDLNTPEGQQAFLDQVNQLQTAAGPAQTEIQSYVTANCGAAGSSGSASPTS